MSNIKRYRLEAPLEDQFEVVVEIDHDLFTEELMHEINNFWSGNEDRLSLHDGNVLHAVLELLYTRTWWSVVDCGGSSSVERMAKYFHEALEGWPPMDGSCGIKFISFDNVEFDHTPQIEEVSL